MGTVSAKALSEIFLISMQEGPKALNMSSFALLTVDV